MYLNNNRYIKSITVWEYSIRGVWMKFKVLCFSKSLPTQELHLNCNPFGYSNSIKFSLDVLVILMIYLGDVSLTLLQMFDYFYFT